MNLHSWQFDSRTVLSMGPTSDPIANKLFSFQSLPKGWHYGRGRAASSLVVTMALSLVSELRSLGATKFEVFPEVSGEILVSAYHENICIDVTVQQNGTFSYVVERGAKEVGESNKPLQLWELAAKIGAEKWLPGNSSDLYILNTTVKNNLGLSPPRSTIRTVAAFQWSMNAA